jgi:competence ComEA-like helix-hairpin-helix protein
MRPAPRDYAATRVCRRAYHARMPPAERRALFLLLSLALVGQGVRWIALRPGEAPGEVEILAAMPPGSPAAHRDSVAALARPLAAGERIDADRASALELARLPKVGPALARTIVAYREKHGAFGGLEALDAVPGLGPGLMAAIGPHLAFSASNPPNASGGSPGARPLDLNTASAEALDALPGIGPARAASIVQYRARHGPFRSVEDLGRVPGMGPAALARVRAHLLLP